MIETHVSAVVSSAAGTVSPDTPASEAAQQLRDPTVPALVVLDREERVVGIVTDSDFVALVAETRESVPVEAIMSTPVATIAPNLPTGLAADRMSEIGVKHLPVVENETYRGLVFLRSLAPYLARSRLEIAWKGEPLRVDAPRRNETVAVERTSE